eukprot:SAG11_NODE_4042_length_2090_cov_2.286791_2_plen_58_part_00
MNNKTKEIFENMLAQKKQDEENIGKLDFYRDKEKIEECEKQKDRIAELEEEKHYQMR